MYAIVLQTLCKTLIEAVLMELSIEKHLRMDTCYLENLRRYAMKTQLFIHHYVERLSFLTKDFK